MQAWTDRRGIPDQAVFHCKSQAEMAETRGILARHGCDHVVDEGALTIRIAGPKVRLFLDRVKAAGIATLTTEL